MENNGRKKSVYAIVRALHRDIGYLVIGMVILHTISGIELVYRDRNLSFITRPKQTTVRMMPNIKPEDLRKDFRFSRRRDFTVTRVEDSIVYFPGGSYNMATGDASMTVREPVFPFNTFIKVHKAISSQKTHWVNVLFGIAMLFLAVSSFWMFAPGTRMFRRGVCFAAAGIVITVVLMLLTAGQSAFPGAPGGR